MDDLSTEEALESNILYELLIYAEWQQEPEIQSRGTAERQDEKNQSSSWRFLEPLFSPFSCPPNLIQQLTKLQMPWQFAVGGDGKVVAILQDQTLEIRSARDEYGSVIGRSTVPKDPYPQWRKILWSPDCTMLAVGFSNGNVGFFDLIGAPLFSITTVAFSSTTNPSNDLSLAISGMVFTDVQAKNTQWSFEFLVANYKGKLFSFLVSSTDGYQERHSFNFSSHHPNGITALCYHQSSNLLLVSGRSHRIHSMEQSNKALQKGISAWRILSDYPHYKLVTSLNDDLVVSKKSWWDVVRKYRLPNTSYQDVIFKMSISPSGDVLAAIHMSGALSLWNLPSLRLRKFWDLQLQPNYTDINPQYCEPGMKRKAAAILSDPLRFHITDVNWWSNDALILVRCCGAVTVSSVFSLKNLLGISPEWFEPSAQVSSFCDRGFLAMECESRISTKKRRPSGGSENVEGNESSDDEDYSVFSKTTEIAKKMLYFVTDSERFQPPRKKPKFINKTYRLLCLKSTTPEELFTRKINNEEYGEALALAKTYNLDCDLVYQRQWRKTTVSVASIQDYLSKITKRSWVLHECLERVPETIDAARELLMYGLCGTDLEALVAIGKGEDHGRFIMSQSSDNLDDMCNMFSVTSDDEEERNKREVENKRRSEMLKQINFKKLTLEQKQLCQCRLKLLTYLDRLNTYEIILGGPGVAEEHYDHMFFKQFRLQSGLEASITFARTSNWRAVSAMFTYHGEETLIHRLPILSNFPEITSPVEYQSLLPKLEYPKDNQIYPWSEDRLRNPDWCEVKYPRQCSTPLAQDFIVDFYEENKHLLKYRQRLTGKLLTEWFTERAKEIETKSNLVDNALELIKLGIERNVQSLEKLLDDLITMEVLIYECHIEKKFSFKNLEQMSDFDKLQMLMSQCTEENFIKNARLWLVPFLNRCESHEPGNRKELLKRYLESLSKEGLNYCRKVFENSKPGQSDPIISDVQEVVSLALDCLYACERSDQLKDACIILDCIQANLHSFDQVYKNSVSHLISMLENHIRVAELLENNGVAVTLGFIRSNWNNVEEVKKLLTKVTRLAGRRHPVLDESQWRNMLHDILEMKKMLFSCIAFEDIYEIFLQSLLCSGQNETIVLAGKMMQCSQKQRKERESTPYSNFIYWYKLPYSRSVNLVLLAAQEHFNSSASVSDPCMVLAKACLNLIEDVPSSIEMELDLISSLSLLQEFNVSILPLQVRLCSERITLVNQALKNKGNAYKNVYKLLQLAYLLRVCGNNKKEREGKVLSLVATAAFSAKDYDTCANVCKRLIEGGHEEGWKVCYSLGGCVEFLNIAERCELMSFAVAHCTSDLLEAALKNKMELHLQSLYDRIKFLMGDDFDQDTKEDSPDGLVEPESQEHLPDTDSNKYSLWHTGEKTLQVLHHTRKTTKVVLSSMGSSSFWKDAVRWIPLGLQWNGNGDDSVQNNKDLKLQGVCAFYSGLFGNVHISKLETNYQRYARQDIGQSLEIASSLVRAAFIEDTLKVEAEKSRIDMRVLLDLAKACLPEDATLCLAYLLSLKKVEDAEEIFKTLPSTPVVLQFACLYYAMKLCSCLGFNHVFSAIDEFQEDPSNVIRQVLDSMKSTEANHSMQPKEVEVALHHLNKYNNMLYDFIQAEILHSIGGGVDAVRFAKDDVYKQETILGIAMTLDDSVFDIAVSLAHHYKLPLWDVYMAHLEHLFSLGSLSASEIEARVEKVKLLNVLLTGKEKFRDRLVSYVYPNIEGKNHPVLLLYYSFLEHCGDKPDEIGIAPSSHAKLIAKFRKAIPSLDYKLLLKPVMSPLNYLSTLMNESNIHVLAKVASKIPAQNGEFLTSSALYCAWGKKYFFEGKDSGKKRLLSTSEWLHRYEACGDIVQRMSPTDVIDFFNHIIFSEMAVEMLSIDGRIEITRRGIKHCRQRSARSKDTNNDEWKEVIGILEHNIQHLQRLEDEMLVQLRISPVPEIRSYAKEFDMSRCVPEELKSLLIKVVMAGTDLSVLQTFLSFCPSDLSWEPGDAFIEAVSLLLKQMKYPEVTYHSYLDHKPPVSILEQILGDVYKYKDELMVEDFIIEQLHEYCSDDEVPVSNRLSVLEVLEKISTLPEEYRELLLLYRTQALVSSTWPEYEVSCEDVTQESKRIALFNRLLESSCSIHHYHILAAILCHWPAFESPFSEDPASNPWTKVLCALASLPEKKGLDEMVKLVDKIHSISTLSETCCIHVYKELTKCGSFVHKMKFALKTDYESLHEMAVEELSGDIVVPDGDIDDELLELILKQHIVSQVVNTNLYSSVIEYLVNHQEESSTKAYLSGDRVVNELASAGHTTEAGSLLLILSETHLGLSSFTSAAHVLQRWLSSARS